jgi:hypothetical protein
MKIALIIPSRGLIHSRTVESILANAKYGGFDCDWYMAHGLPIPDCFNLPTEQALKGKYDYLWFVEEDMLIPKVTLKRMVEKDSDVVSVDYADRRTGEPFLKRNKQGEVVYTGVGCMLVKWGVFADIKSPYFRTGLFEEQPDGNIKEVELKKPRETYGTQDVYFCKSLRDAGYKIDILENTNIGHLQIDGWGKDGLNNGTHDIHPVYIK